MSDVAGQLTFDDTELARYRQFVRDVARGRSFDWTELRDRAIGLLADVER